MGSCRLAQGAPLGDSLEGREGSAREALEGRGICVHIADHAVVQQKLT